MSSGRDDDSSVDGLDFSVVMRGTGCSGVVSCELMVSDSFPVCCLAESSFGALSCCAVLFLWFLGLADVLPWRFPVDRGGVDGDGGFGANVMSASQRVASGRFRFRANRFRGVTSAVPFEAAAATTTVSTCFRPPQARHRRCLGWLRRVHFGHAHWSSRSDVDTDAMENVVNRYRRCLCLE
jgi:hypothetical protein